jgi:hypothetical protein
MRNSSSTPRTSRSTGQPSRPRSERTKIEKRKPLSETIYEQVRTDTDIKPIL